jgi:hypothetical protein
MHGRESLDDGVFIPSGGFRKREAFAELYNV